MMKEYEDWKKAILAKVPVVNEASLVRYWNSGYTPDDVVFVRRAYQANALPKEVFEAASRCGCFHCLAFFDPKEIRDWEGAAWCPRCNIDAVLPETDDYKLSEELLKRLQVMQFTNNSTDDFDLGD